MNIENSIIEKDTHAFKFYCFIYIPLGLKIQVFAYQLLYMQADFENKKSETVHLM